MGTVYTELTLENAADVMLAQRDLISVRDVRSVIVDAMVDTGAGTLVINEEVSQKLGLKTWAERESTLADGSKRMYQQMNPVKIHWENRDMICQPILIPGADEILLGAFPLQEMDLIVDPKQEKLTGRHGDILYVRV